jgi:hypothetical protein
MYDPASSVVQGLSLVNPLAELVRMMAALARSRAAVIFSWLEAWARGW